MPDEGGSSGLAAAVDIERPEPAMWGTSTRALNSRDMGASIGPDHRPAHPQRPM